MLPWVVPEGMRVVGRGEMNRCAHMQASTMYVRTPTGWQAQMRGVRRVVEYVGESMQRIEVVVMIVQNKGREWYECEKEMQGEGIQARIIINIAV